MHEVVRKCLYAVDKNPLAIDLCKVALWIEGHVAGLPLSFLDHHVKCGDLLIGVFNLTVVVEGIPDDAYKPLTGDDRNAAREYRKRNAAERKGQLTLDLDTKRAVTAAPVELAPDFERLAAGDDRTPDDVHRNEEEHRSFRLREVSYAGIWVTL